MILITGGAFQGKREYVKKKLGVAEAADGSACGFEEAFGAKCIANYHELVKRLIKAGADPTDFTERLCLENPELIVIINEIGCGVIPLEKEDRIWREAVGRCGCILAQRAETVVRLTCGIPQALKGELP